MTRSPTLELDCSPSADFRICGSQKLKSVGAEGVGKTDNRKVQDSLDQSESAPQKCIAPPPSDGLLVAVGRRSALFRSRQKPRLCGSVRQQETRQKHARYRRQSFQNEEPSPTSCQSTVATPSGGLLTTSSLRYGTVAAQIQVTSGPVNITGITVNGNTSACPSYPYFGIFYSSGSSGTVNNVETLYQLCQPVVSPSQGYAVLVENGVGAIQSVAIENSNFNNFSQNGIVVYGDQSSSPTLNVSIKNNWVTGGDYGIMLLGNVQGIISGNVIQTGLTGVYAGSPNLTVSGNTLQSGNIGVEISSPAVTVSSNRIFNEFQAGISIESPNDNVQNNRIAQVPIGIEFNCSAQASGAVTGNTINGASTGLDMVPLGFAGINQFFGVANPSTGCS